MYRAHVRTHVGGYGGVVKLRRLRAGCEQNSASGEAERNEQPGVGGMDIRIHQWSQDLIAGGGEKRQIRRLRLRLRISVDHQEPRCTEHGGLVMQGGSGSVRDRKYA